MSCRRRYRLDQADLDDDLAESMARSIRHTAKWWANKQAAG